MKLKHLPSAQERNTITADQVEMLATVEAQTIALVNKIFNGLELKIVNKTNRTSNPVKFAEFTIGGSCFDMRGFFRNQELKNRERGEYFDFKNENQNILKLNKMFLKKPKLLIAAFLNDCDQNSYFADNEKIKGWLVCKEKEQLLKIIPEAAPAVKRINKI